VLRLRRTGGEDYFIEMNNSGGPVDVWAIAGIEESALVESSNGFRYFRAPIPADDLTLVRRDVPAVTLDPSGDAGGLEGSVTVTFRPRRPDQD
jgi:hypothetical protein